METKFFNSDENKVQDINIFKNRQSAFTAKFKQNKELKVIVERSEEV